MIEDIQYIDMTPIFERYPALEVVEKALDPRFERRRPILNYIPRWSRGAEIGVFTGQFSEFMVQVTKPITYFAVDPWHTLYGEFFPNWGEYSADGTLHARAGFEAAQHRLARFKGANVVAAMALDWINSLEPDSLDWAYVDSTHQYGPTLAELHAISKKLAPGGIILGDDCWCRRDNKHYGVYRAVRDFCREAGFEIMIMDHAGQFAARKTID
ncbi:class I SAM-dependent methyltransferase [Rhizobium sp. CNPSo 4062]|uniref:class I SAM-dependent methyltransferase n=1 Tax=Rhizobium sp. CNPSo 4062 TaxID=3021410 RepID=UPI000DE071B5|nr:class I SAM-dependent methyltransferase [Rhizobium sp. CNPSo 4062]MDK4705019.1 class I SAM-dependent methyltransferase [Rhizobium sp. CNPSo 4062]